MDGQLNDVVEFPRIVPQHDDANPGADHVDIVRRDGTKDVSLGLDSEFENLNANGVLRSTNPIQALHGFQIVGTCTDDSLDASGGPIIFQDPSGNVKIQFSTGVVTLANKP